ncbi:MAG: D-alanyl-D-alanine carboxypeptidase family protein [Rhodospirillales bacterium]|nr:D-alanyl-D-alanine carboxypeptidase family protein [Acetobacter sp.]
MIAQAATELNLIYGQAGGRAETEIMHVPHDIDHAQFEALNLSSDLRLAASHFLPKSCEEEIIPALHHLGPIVRVGPRQQALLDAMATAGVNISVLSGFRSVHFQALLYASRYLDGSLFDADSRAYVALPGHSEHHQPDQAIDVEDPVAFALAALQFRNQVSVDQPYLYHLTTAKEPWHFSTNFSDNFGDKSAADSFIDQAIAGLSSYFLANGNVAYNNELIFVSGRSTWLCCAIRSSGRVFPFPILFQTWTNWVTGVPRVVKRLRMAART